MRHTPRIGRFYSSTLQAAFCGLFFILASVFVFNSVEAQSGFYQVIDLGLNLPSSLNERREVTIQEQYARIPPNTYYSSQRFAAIWRSDGLRELGVPAGYETSSALALNNNTTVVGYASMPTTCFSGPGCGSPPRDAVVWAADGSSTILPPLPAQGTRPQAVASWAARINNAGEIVGTSGDGHDISRGGWSRAVLWRADTIIELQHAAGTWQSSGATGINEIGDVVGWVQTDGPDSVVKFYYDDETHWFTDSVAGAVVAVGSFQQWLGCRTDWQPDCLRSWLKDPDGDGIYTFTTTQLPAGQWGVKVTIGESWAENYGRNGELYADPITFTVNQNGNPVVFRYDASTHILTVSTP